MIVLLGVDVGSSGCKVTAINPDGSVVASGSKSYATHYPRPGWAEQDPEDWYGGACGAIRTCLDSGRFRPDEVAGLAFVGPAHNVALLDETGRVLRPTLHWSDLRSREQSEWLAQEHGEAIFRISGQRANPVWTLPQLLWIRENEPETWSRLHRIMVTKDYVRYRFTGTYLTESFDAIGTMLYDLKEDHWSPQLCGLLGMDPRNLPTVAPAESICGGVLAEAAAESGLIPGTPVAVGGADSAAEAFGVGVIDAGQAVVKLGTSVCFNLVTREPRPSLVSLTYRHLVAGRGFTVTATNSGTATLRWFRETFFGDDCSFEEITRTAARAPSGSAGLLFHPYLMGERTPYWDPGLRGDFLGIGTHHRLEHFARAILEGVAYSVRDCAEAASGLGEQVKERILLGGGSRSSLWAQIVCDVLGVPLRKPVVDDAGYGAAMLAGVATGIFEGWRQAANLAAVEKVLEPESSAQRLYDELFDVYRSVTRDVAVYSRQLAGLAEKTSKP